MSITVLGVDPSFTCTGYALMTDGDFILANHVRLTDNAETRGAQLTKRIAKLFNTLNLVADAIDIDVLAVERTDWQRNLKNNAEWRKEYAMERRAQESLALLQGALCAFAWSHNIKFVLLGVVEWHKQFGANNKDAIAELLVREYPDFIEKCDCNKFGYRLVETQEDVDNNMTDAMGLTKVAYDMEKQSRMVMV